MGLPFLFIIGIPMDTYFAVVVIWYSGWQLPELQYFYWLYKLDCL